MWKLPDDVVHRFERHHLLGSTDQFRRGKVVRHRTAGTSHIACRDRLKLQNSDRYLPQPIQPGRASDAPCARTTGHRARRRRLRGKLPPAHLLVHRTVEYVGDPVAMNVAVDSPACGVRGRADDVSVRENEHFLKDRAADHRYGFISGSPLDELRKSPMRNDIAINREFHIRHLSDFEET